MEEWEDRAEFIDFKLFLLMTMKFFVFADLAELTREELLILLYGSIYYSSVSIWSNLSCCTYICKDWGIIDWYLL